MHDLIGGDPAPGGDTAIDQPGFLGPESDEPSFLPAVAAPNLSPASPYRVLARKYRPQTFDDLIGQDAMVRTVSNAFATDRIPQAWMLTGVRGVGKTTTARILARALNYAASDGNAGGPTVTMPALGVHCRSIMESRHVDVLEMDAASHTGVENIRQITDAVRYAPVQARYKVYIIDEVHMLSAAAFNAFLKTLEEPPPHAKFVFATTEIRKVPVTILSRCQRFDLRRVETGALTAHLARICAAEEVVAEPEALAAIARAAEGSVRDSLSLLDQAVADGAGRVSAAAVRQMLGQADRGQVIDLFEAVMRGDVPTSLAALKTGWDSGADPGQMLSDLAAFTHLVTRLKLVADARKDPALTEAERVRGSRFAETLGIRALSRAWQVLSKAVPEVGASGRPLAAAEMALIRLAYAADLPTPDEALRALRSGVEPKRIETAPAPHVSASPAPVGGPPLPHAEVPAASRPRRTQDGGASVGAPLREAPQDEEVGRVAEPTSASPVPALAAAEPSRAAPAADTQPGIALRRFEDVVALAAERRAIGLKTALERDMRLVRFEEGRIEIALVEGASRNLPTELTRALADWTGHRWTVALSADAGQPTIDEVRRGRERDRHTDAASHPLVRKVLASFPGAQIVDVRDRNPEPEAEAPLPSPDPDGLDADPDGVETGEF